MGVRRARVTPSTFIFDTNVLSAFAIAGQLSQLEVRYRHRAHWVDVVHSEIARGVSTEPALGDVLAATWLAPPIETFALADIERVRQCRRRVKTDPVLPVEF